MFQLNDDSFKKAKAQRRKDAFNRLKKQFGIYYKSTYGKIGLYILVIFAVIAIISPIIAPLPYSYVAPTIDTHVAKLRLQTELPSDGSGSLYSPITASSTLSTGSFIVAFGTSTGKVYAEGLGGSSSTPVNSSTLLLNYSLPAGNEMYAPSLVSYSNYQSFSLGTLRVQNFLLTGTQNGSITIGEVSWTGGSAGSGKPYMSGTETLQENGTLLYAPVSNSQPLGSILPTYLPFYSVSSTSIGTTGSLYTVTQNATGYYLNAFNAYPLSPLWSVKLSVSVTPGDPSYLGSFYQSSSGTQVIIPVGSDLVSYSAATGTKLWTAKFGSNVSTNAPWIPSAYQSNRNGQDSAFVSTANNNVYGVYSSNGSRYLLLNTSSHIEYLSSSPGSSGFPSAFVTETANSAYLTTSNGTGSFRTVDFKLPPISGAYVYRPIYDQNAATFIFASSNGELISMQTAASEYPYTWHAVITPNSKNITQPGIFLDSSTGREEIGLISQSGYMYAYDATAYPINPIPPTLHAPSGNTYLLGTNINGQDVFNQFIQSFSNDWEIGIAIGVAVMVVAVVVAMIVGYIGGSVGTAFETLSIATYLIPGLALLIAMASVLGAGYLNLVLIVTVISWPFTTFTLIGLVRQVKARSFVEAAKLSGARTPAILRRHVLPNIAPLLLYLLAISINGAIAGVSTLQFLGIAPLTEATWGGMLSPMLGNFFLAYRAPWWVLPPSIALTMFIFAFVFVSRGLDEVTNPRLRRR